MIEIISKHFFQAQQHETRNQLQEEKLKNKHWRLNNKAVGYWKISKKKSEKYLKTKENKAQFSKIL